MKKRVIISSNTTWNVYNFRLGLIRSLQSKGYHIISLAPYDKYVCELESLGVKCYDININQKGTNPVADILLFIRYIRLFYVIRPHLILSYTIKPNIYGNFAANVLGIPVVNNISGLGTLFIRTNFFSNIGKLLYKIALKSSVHIFFQNNSDRNLFLQDNLVSPSKSSVIPGSGVNTDVFKQNRTSNCGRKFLFVGRLIGDKGVFEYLEAAACMQEEYPNVEFLLAGQLGYNNKTALTLKELNSYTDVHPNIVYLGKIEDMYDLLASVDVVVLPSYREGLSKSLVEAASMSLPIITTDVPGCVDIVEHEYNGLICKVKSTESLKLSIKKMINLTAEKRHQMGLNGRNIILTKFDEIIVIKHYLNVINSILN
jgi:glycosyltransferase involved in cell wall biosynthesis